jgi:glycosyltransferase involved in cell wall biosynthesis
MSDTAAGMPRVSVIIPTYNRADFLPQTIQSVLDQTFHDFEILIIDDGSTDDTEHVVRRIDDSRVIYVRQGHSGLPSVARNTGLHHARGDYIAFLDSDDLWLSEKLALQVQYMDSHPEVGLSYTDTYRFTADPEQYDPRPVLRSETAHSGHVFALLYGQQVIPNLTVVIRSSVVEQVGMFDEDARLKANEDYEYWLRIAHQYPVGYLDKPLALYRQHPEGISKAAVATNQAKLWLVEKLDRIYPDFVARHPDQRRRWLSKVHYSLGRGLLREQKVNEARHHLKKSWQLQRRPATGLFLAASFCGKRVYQGLDGLKTRLWDGSTHGRH